MVISSSPCYLNLLCHQPHVNWYSFIPSSCTCVIIVLPQLVNLFHHFVAHHIVHVPPHVATLIWICHQLSRMTIWMQLKTFKEMYQVQKFKCSESLLNKQRKNHMGILQKHIFKHTQNVSLFCIKLKKSFYFKCFLKYTNNDFPIFFGKSSECSK